MKLLHRNDSVHILCRYKDFQRKGGFTMTAEAILVWVIVGAVAGWLASLVMGTNRSQGLLADIVIGIVGGVLGGFLLGALGIGGAVTGVNLTSVVVAFVGAVILIAILRAVRST
jgi:uncharacterized membrane protein YeaQ/YmgE (transglycosylase-associated protein family)